MSVEKYEKDEQIKKVRPMNTGREGEIFMLQGGHFHNRIKIEKNANYIE